MDGGKKVAVPDLRAAIRRVLAQNDIRRKIRVERSQAEAEPCPDAGQRDRRRARMHRQHRLKMLDDVGVQAPHDTESVRHAAEMRKGEASRGSTSVPRRWMAETLFPWSTARRGLESNVSTCEKPPVRKTKI